jgi:hypothetical protein
MKPIPVIRPSITRAVAFRLTVEDGFCRLDKSAGGECYQRKGAQAGATFLAFAVPPIGSARM